MNKKRTTIEQSYIIFRTVLYIHRRITFAGFAENFVAFAANFSVFDRKTCAFILRITVTITRQVVKG